TVLLGNNDIHPDIYIADFVHHLKETTPLMVLFILLLQLLLLDLFTDVGAVDLELSEAVTEGDHLFQGYRRIEYDAGNIPLTLFDTLCNLDFAFSGKKGDRTHFTKIHPHRVTGPAERSRFELLLFLLALALLFVLEIKFGLWDLYFLDRVDDLDFHLTKHAHHIVYLLRRDNIRGKEVVNLFVGKKSLFLTHVDKLLYLFNTLFGHEIPLVKADRLIIQVKQIYL